MGGFAYERPERRLKQKGHCGGLQAVTAVIVKHLCDWCSCNHLATSSAAPNPQEAAASHATALSRLLTWCAPLRRRFGLIESDPPRVPFG
jgi:hypothetical protein